jgi:hypothetical protein
MVLSMVKNAIAALQLLPLLRLPQMVDVLCLALETLQKYAEVLTA